MIMLLPEEVQESRTDSLYQNENVVGRDQIVQWKKSLGVQNLSSNPSSLFTQQMTLTESDLNDLMAKTQLPIQLLVILIRL